MKGASKRDPTGKGACQQLEVVPSAVAFDVWFGPYQVLEEAQVPQALQLFKI